MKKQKKKELSSEHLKNLQKEMRKLESAEKYLDKEKSKLIKDKEKIRIKIKIEKDILKLKQKIERVKERKK